MTRMPGAIWRPITRNYTNRNRARTNALILHIAASEAASLHGWFNNPAARASSHLYVRRDGTIEQYVDLDHTTWANKQGDARAVTVETQGMGHGRWTQAQVDALARIAAFVHQHYGVPLEPMYDSKTTTAGIGYHRLGVDPWRVPGGESWSGAYGKICPGPERISQVPTVISLARKHAGTTTTTTTTSTEDEVPKAIIFSSAREGGDSQYIAFPHSRTYEHIDDDQDRADFINILQRQGFDVEEWKNRSGSSNVGNPDVFGKFVGGGPKPLNAKREN